MGRYVVEEQIGSGGMAAVFRARLVGAEGFSRPVALKRIAAHLSSDPQFAELFIAEARLAALLGHPNVVSVIDFDRDEDGTLFLAMELVEGTDLRRLARANGGPLPVSLALYVAAETLRGLAHAHELAKDGKRLGLVHRDVSPHNILVSRAGGVKVADFGIAKASAASSTGTGHGVIKGKLPYMAPEQAAGQPVDARTDLWAVGIVLYELLVGARPFDGATDPETLARVLRADLPPLPSSIPHDVAVVLRSLLARDRTERPASADVAAVALRSCQTYPTNGEKELGALVVKLAPIVRGAQAREAAARPPRTLTRDAETPRGAATPTPTPTIPQRRRWVLPVLGVVAALSVTAAVIVARREPASGPLPVAAAPVVEPNLTPPPPPATAPVPVAISAAQPTTPAATEVAPARPGRLALRARATWANIRVDEESWGTTPQTRELAAGRHKVTFWNTDLDRRETRTVTVDPGRTRTLEADW